MIYQFYTVHRPVVENKYSNNFEMINFELLEDAKQYADNLSASLMESYRCEIRDNGHGYKLANLVKINDESDAKQFAGFEAVSVTRIIREDENPSVPFVELQESDLVALNVTREADVYGISEDSLFLNDWAVVYTAEFAGGCPDQVGSI